MNFAAINKNVRKTYKDSDVVANRIKLCDLGKQVTTITQGYTPDSLYDSNAKRYKKLKSVSGEYKKYISLFLGNAYTDNLIIYQFSHFLKDENGVGINNDIYNNVYSRKTLSFARKVDRELFENTPRIIKLESAGTRNGELHLQGVFAIDSDNIDKKLDNIKALDYIDIEEVSYRLAYDKKPPAQRVQRDKTGKLKCPYELYLYEVGLWYYQTLLNHKAGQLRNPRTSWYVTG